MVDSAAVPTRPGTAPTTSSDTVLVTTFTYDPSSGRQIVTADPAGTESSTWFDDLGRTIWVAANFNNFEPSNLSTIGDATDKSKDQVVKTEFDGLGSTTRIIAYNESSAAPQETIYLYEDSISAELVTSEIYPDSADTTSAGTDQVKYTYLVDGARATRTDQRGTVIAYAYENLRRPKSDKVTTLGGSTDGAIRSITLGYDVLGRLAKVTSHGNQTDDPDNTTDVANQIVLTFDDLGRVSKSEQSHSVFVAERSVGRSLRTEESGHGVSDDNRTILVEYSHTGGGRAVIADYQQPDVKLDLFRGTSGTYAGLDRFGRTIDHFWDGYNSTADAVRIKYGYDHASNRIWREDVIAENNSQNFDELYSHDGLDRLIGMERGEIDGTYTSISSDTFGQDWTLDHLGNWSNFLEDSDGNGTNDLDQDRSHNDVNEITTIDSSSSHIGHDAAGNSTTIPQPGSWSTNYTLVWDAWNRLVKVADGATTIAEYQYDGQSRRVVKKLYVSGTLDETQHLYLSEQNQVLEMRIDSGTSPARQFTWGTRYIDDIVLRTRDSDGNGTLDETLYALHDANWNVMALVGTTGTVAERFHYDPYGKSIVLDANFALDSNGVSDVDWEYRYTSREFDAETELYYFRARYLHSGLGRFCSRDPIGYVDGPNMYAYTANMPLIGMDPSGLQVPIPLPRIVPLPRVYPRIHVPPPTPPKPFIPFPPVPAPVPVPMPNGGPDPRPTPEPIPPNQPYPGDDMEPPGDCSQAQYDLLRNAVQRDCKAGELQSCRDGLLPWRCSSYKDMAEKYTACADARRRLDQACFRGGDRGHQIQEGQMRNGAQWCWYYYRKCKPCSQPQGPLIAGGPGGPSPTAMSASLE